MGAIIWINNYWHDEIWLTLRFTCNSLDNPMIETYAIATGFLMHFSMKRFAHAKRYAPTKLIFEMFDVRKRLSLLCKYLLGSSNHLYCSAICFGLRVAVNL